MDISPEQLDCVMHGMAPSITWEPVPLPTGRQVLPDWLGKCRIDWMMDYGNAPYFRMEHNNASHWTGMSWVEDKPGRFVTRHPDGRASCYYHRGAMTPGFAWNVLRAKTRREYLHKWQLADSLEAALVAANEKHAQLEQSHAERPGWAPMYSDGECGPLLPVACGCTISDEQDGFGGSHYMLTMADGTYRLLRGPWSGATPEGYVQPLCSGMLVITEDLFLRIVADRAPHVGVARVNYGYRNELEVYDLNWGMPKKLWQETQR